MLDLIRAHPTAFVIVVAVVTITLESVIARLSGRRSIAQILADDDMEE